MKFKRGEKVRFLEGEEPLTVREADERFGYLLGTPHGGQCYADEEQIVAWQEKKEGAMQVNGHMPFEAGVAMAENIVRLGDENKRMQEQIQAVRGAIIGALAGGHMDGPQGASYSKSVLLQIADLLEITVPETSIPER